MAYTDGCPSRHARMGVDGTTGVLPTVGVFASAAFMIAARVILAG